MKNLSETEMLAVFGGTATPTNGTAGVAGVYSTINGLSSAAEAVGQLATDVGDFFKGVAAGMYDAL